MKIKMVKSTCVRSAKEVLDLILIININIYLTDLKPTTIVQTLVHAYEMIYYRNKKYIINWISFSIPFPNDTRASYTHQVKSFAEYYNL